MFTLRSSDGYTEVAFSLTPRGSMPAAVGSLLSAVLEGKFWDRSAPDVTSSSLVEDFRIDLCQVPTTRGALAKLSSEIGNWLTTGQAFRVELASGPNQSLLLELGEREGVVFRQDRPTTTLQYRGERMEAEWFFVVDQSCLTSLRDDLERALGRV